MDFQEFVWRGTVGTEIDARKLSAVNRMQPLREPIKYPANNFIHEFFRGLIRSLNAADGQPDRHRRPGEASADGALTRNSRAKTGGKSLRLKAIQPQLFPDCHQDGFSTIEAVVEVRQCNLIRFHDGNTSPL